MRALDTQGWRREASNSDFVRILYISMYTCTAFRWGLVEAEFFVDLIVDIVGSTRACFFVRREYVESSAFDIFGLDLIYEEVESLRMRMESLTTGADPESFGDEESPMDTGDEGEASEDSGEDQDPAGANEVPFFMDFDPSQIA